MQFLFAHRSPAFRKSFGKVHNVVTRSSHIEPLPPSQRAAACLAGPARCVPAVPSRTRAEIRTRPFATARCCHEAAHTHHHQPVVDAARVDAFGRDRRGKVTKADVDCSRGHWWRRSLTRKQSSDRLFPPKKGLLRLQTLPESLESSTLLGRKLGKRERRKGYSILSWGGGGTYYVQGTFFCSS